MSRSAPARILCDKRSKTPRQKDLLLSLHLKATMMKVSDPIIFGHAVRVYYRDVFEKYGDIFGTVGSRDRATGLGIFTPRSTSLPAEQQQAIKADIEAVYADRSQIGDGRFRQGNHQSACAQSCDHRRLDAGSHSILGQDVGTGWQAARHQGDDSRSMLRRCLSGDRSISAKNTAPST